jgi:hypothetical protein
MVKLRKLSLLACFGVLMMASCSFGGGDGNEAAQAPTDTLAPLVSLSPRFTATPLSTRTPLPTFTPIPSETPIPPTPSNTPTPTPTEPIIGIIRSVNTVNIREGPAVSFGAIRALNPGTGVEVLGQNPDGGWLNILMEDGEEGWVSTALVFLEETSTPFPTLTPSPDLTSLAQGTSLPTAIIGGGTVTPTPPRSAVSPTPPGTTTSESASGSAPTQSFLPVIDVDAINQTATALAGGIIPISPPAPVEAAVTGQSPNSQTTPGGTLTAVSTPPTAVPGGNTNAQVQEGADVFALCNDTSFRTLAPANIAAGSTVDVYWAWFVSDPSYVQQHVDAVTYEVRVNGELLTDWRQYGLRTRQVGNSYAKYWYVPFGPLDAGTYNITYRATWSEQITDGYENFGPGTRNPVEEGSCTFTVR